MRAVLLAFAVAACSPSPPPVSAIEVPIAADAAPPPEPSSDKRAPTAIVDASAAPATSSGAMERALAGWSKTTQCSSFDYHPQGGIQSFWCHRPKSVDVSAVRALSGMARVFVSGPHRGDELVLDAPNDFGHYDPAFVRWLVDHAGPSARESAARRAAQPAYDAHVKPLATIFWRTWQKTQHDAVCFAREKNDYAELVAKRRVPKDYYERWFWFMNPFFCTRGLKGGDAFYFDNGFDAGIDGNVTKTVVGFWIRRTLDGTAATFAEGLRHLIESYQPELLASPRPPPDAASITPILDAGVRAAAACRDPNARAATTQVDVAITPDGHVRAAVPWAGMKGTAQERCLVSSFSSGLAVPLYDGGEMHFKRSVALR